MNKYRWISKNFSEREGLLMHQVESWCNDNKVLDFKVIVMKETYIEIIAKVEL